MIMSAIRSAGSTIVTGTLNSTASTTFTLDFFANPACHSSGSGDGRSYIGSTQVTTDASCNATINAVLPVFVPLGQIVTATATDPSGNTSELSSCSSPTGIQLVDFTAEGYDTGALLEWRTGYEADNLGFNIYRDYGGKRALINPHMIAGSAVAVGQGVTLHAGGSYTWWDSTPSGKGTSYWIEALDLNGSSRWYGPVSIREPAFGSQVPARRIEQAKLLASRGRSRAESVPLERRVKLGVATAATAQNQFALASGPAVKISVKQEGWYRVSQPELISAGLNPAVDPRLLQLYVDGRQVPISVTGEGDGRLDPSDSVQFYGVGLDSPFSDLRVYWLVAAKQPGLRIASVLESSLAFNRRRLPLYSRAARPHGLLLSASQRRDRELLRCGDSKPTSHSNDYSSTQGCKCNAACLARSRITRHDQSAASSESPAQWRRPGTGDLQRAGTSSEPLLSGGIVDC